MGRPTKLRKVHHVTKDGREVTVDEVVIGCVRKGQFPETSAAIARVAKTTIYGWLEMGAKAADMRKRGETLTRYQAECLIFSDRMAEAAALHEMEMDVAIAAAGLEPQVTETSVTKRIPVTNAETGETHYVEQTEIRRVVAPPDALNLRWRQARRFRERWGDKGALELSGPEGGPIRVDDASERGQALLAELEAYSRGVSEGREEHRPVE